MTRPRGITPDDDDRIVAGVELVARTGARNFEVGFLHDDVPAHEADWYAHAQYRGTRITVEHHSHPADAVEALAVQLLTGAKCACGKLVALQPGGALAFRSPVMSDGSTFTIEQAREVGQCHWKREGAHWVSGCGLRAARRRKLSRGPADSHRVGVPRRVRHKRGALVGHRRPGLKGGLWTVWPVNKGVSGYVFIPITRVDLS